jgi:hypothetical protein
MHLQACEFARSKQRCTSTARTTRLAVQGGATPHTGDARLRTIGIESGPSRLPLEQRELARAFEHSNGLTLRVRIRTHNIPRFLILHMAELSSHELFCPFS